MSHFIAEQALLDDGFAADVRIDVSADGTIIAVTPHARGEASRVPGVLLPGMTDLHSHAFQRSFAGRTGQARAGDDFWSWREAMYRAGTRIGPAAMRAITAYLGMRLLEGGYTTLVEFHYLFNQPGGELYGHRTAMTDALIEGAKAAGIGLTVLFGLYEAAGFDGGPLAGGQRRFANTARQALAMLAEALPHATTTLNFGLAPHSLRAVPAHSLRAMLDGLATMPAVPVHIHVAEQVAEVAGCLQFLGAAPIDWLLDHAPVASNWCLIHATHATPGELGRVAAAGAVIGLCPSTEADLGDGIFDFASFMAAGGLFGIGSDSNISLRACDELRLLEYAQRLHRRRRNLGVGREYERLPHTGVSLWQAAALGGAQACGRPVGRIAPGCRADFCALAATPETAGAAPGFIVDAAIFAPDDQAIHSVMAGGKWLVRDGRHIDAARITQDYEQALAMLA